MTQQIPTLTRAIQDHSYVTMKDLANAILDTDEENQRLADALTALVNGPDMNLENLEPATVEALTTARNLLEQRELKSDTEWLKED